MAEARAYAMRNRQGSNWFGDSSPAAAPAPAPAPAAAAPTTPTKAAVSSPSKNGTDSTTPAVGGGRTQMIKPTCNSNDWFKSSDDGGGGGAKAPPPPPSGKRETPKGPSRQPTGDWYAPGTGTPSAADEKRDATRPRVVTSEGESNCRRDKAGSSAAWFSHEHGKEAAPPPAQGGAGPRVTSKEGSGNATRMRGESENWYNHDSSASAPAAAAPPQGSRGRGVPPRSSEMHHVFHHADDAGK